MDMGDTGKAEAPSHPTMEGAMCVRCKREVLSASAPLGLPRGQHAEASVQGLGCSQNHAGVGARAGVYQMASSGQSAGRSAISARGLEGKAHGSVWGLGTLESRLDPRLDVGENGAWVLPPNEGGLLLGSSSRPCVRSCLTLPGQHTQPLSPAKWSHKSLYFGL